MEAITARPTETREPALRRLLRVARESGVRLGVDHAGDYWATSTSEPGRLYPVGPESCGCRGFRTHRRCRHLAALWSHLGYLDPEPDPAPMAITCAHTDGHYSLAADPEWVEPFTEILVDGDDKIRIVGDTFELSVHWLEQGKPIDDLTGAMPSDLDHYGAVDYWIGSLDHRVAAHIPMQNAGLFPTGEFTDAEPVAA